MEHATLTEKIIGVFYEVYNTLGYGFLESVYKNSMLVALKNAELEAVAEWPIEVWFQGESVGNFRADVLVDDKVILELKTGRTIEDKHVAQTLNYLKASRINVGLLMNFGHEPKFERLFFDR